MIELIVTDMKGPEAAQRISRAVSRIDRRSRAAVDGAGWVRIETREAPSRFVSAIEDAGFNAVVWWDGRRQ